MRMHIFPLALGVGAFFLPTEGRSELICEATISDIVFGEVYLHAASTLRTPGELQITCWDNLIGGLLGSLLGNTDVQACLSLGQGSGGGTTSARYMGRVDSETLAYQLYSEGYGGTVWNDIEFTVPLNLSGAGAITANIYAAILASGSDIKVGSYSSDFDSSNLVFSYGEDQCETEGSATSFEVRASVMPHCTVTVGSMDFGDISDELATGAEAAANLSVTCTDDAPYAVTLGPGLGPNVDRPESRQMSNGAATLAYGLYHDAGGSRPWSWTLGQDDLTATGSGLSQSYTIHGRVRAGQAAMTGNYADSVVVTVHY